MLFDWLNLEEEEFSDDRERDVVDWMISTERDCYKILKISADFYCTGYARLIILKSDRFNSLSVHREWYYDFVCSKNGLNSVPHVTVEPFSKLPLFVILLAVCCIGCYCNYLKSIVIERAQEHYYCLGIIFKKFYNSFTITCCDLTSDEPGF